MTRHTLGAGAACAFVSAAALAAVGARQAGPSGAYVGNYTCEDRQLTFTVEITRGASGEVTAQGVFPNQYIDYSRRGGWGRRPPDPNTPVDFKGTVDPRSGSVTLVSSDDLQLTRAGKRQKVTFAGAIDTANQFLVGSVQYAGCDRFVLAPRTTRGDPQYAATIYANRIKGQEMQRAAAAKHEEARATRMAGGWTPVELSASGGAVTENRFDYYDATFADTPAPGLAVGIRPIDDVHQWFYENGHKCLSTRQAFWRSGVATATTEIFGRKSYVLECRGECRNLQYSMLMRTNNLMGGTHHGGKSRAYPVITVNASVWTQSTIDFQFKYATSAPARPADIRVHTWSPGWGDYGGGCTID
jgi:hypothetical protein